MNKPTLNWKSENSDHFAGHARQHLLPVYPWLLNDLQQAVGRSLSGLDILEIGAGPGFMLPLFRQAGLKMVCGADISPAMLLNAKESGRTACCNVVVADTHALPFGNSTFDIVYSRGSVFFWKDINAALKQILAVTRPYGTAMIGGGYGISTPAEIVATIKQQHKSSGNQIPRLDTEELVTKAGQIWPSVSLIQAPGRGFWLILKK
jgi:SAM-dependent methyltransferase